MVVPVVIAYLFIGGKIWHPPHLNAYHILEICHITYSRPEFKFHTEAIILPPREWLAPISKFCPFSKQFHFFGRECQLLYLKNHASCLFSQHK